MDAKTAQQRKANKQSAVTLIPITEKNIAQQQKTLHHHTHSSKIIIAYRLITLHHHVLTEWSVVQFGFHRSSLACATLVPVVRWHKKQKKSQGDRVCESTPMHGPLWHSHMEWHHSNTPTHTHKQMHMRIIYRNVHVHANLRVWPLCAQVIPNSN